MNLHGVRNLRMSLFPPPRRAVTWLSVLPLGVFLVLFLGGSLLLDVRGIVLFTRPWAFVLASAAPWLWWLHVAGYGGLRGVRAQVSLWLRLIVLATLIVVLSEPRSVRRSNVLSVVYALDVSDSIGDAADDALGFVVRTASEKPERDEAGLVVFGRDAAVELPPRASFPFEAINVRVGRDGTNLETALSLAAAMVPEGRQARIVLISDGAKTEGALPGVLDDLAARRIPVDVLPVTYDHDHEVWLEKLELPRILKAGETYEPAIILSSLKPGSGTLTLTENGEVVARQQVAYHAGKNRYALPLYLRKPGFYEYVATIDPPPGKDGWQKNNVAVNHIFLRGKGRVLVVTDPGGDPRDWQPVVEALRQGERQVDLRPAYEFPRDPFTLMPYDAIVFVNAPADAFDAVQLEAVRSAVYHQGAGFLMVGGKNSFGPGGYHRTPVERALPVTMDITQKKVLPKGALVIILHTCEFPQGNTWGKRIAKQAIRVLGARDEVGILAYGMGGEGWMFELTPAGEYEKLVPIINRATIGDMPTFASTMKMGFDALVASDAGAKHMIIISDGDPSPPPPDLIAQFQNHQISVSTVAIFPHGGAGDVSVELMRRIARSTRGRFYHPSDPRRLPSIFIKEAKTLRRSMIQNKPFTPEVQLYSPIIKGIDVLHKLGGFVLTTPKPRAEVILTKPNPEEIDPVLAVWRYGVGKTAAFTSDLSSNWGSDWLASPHYRPFVKQLITDIARSRQQTALHLRSFVEASTGTLIVEDFHPEAGFLEILAEVAGPRGKSLKLRLEQVGPRRYRAEFPVWGNGHYHIMASAAGSGRTERALGRFVVPYSPEYLRFRANPIVLRQIARRTGGRELRPDIKGPDLFLKERGPRASSQPVFDWFLIVLACLIPLDVAARRVQLDWFVIRSWLGLDRKRASGETLGALLRRKKTIEFPAADRAERPLEPAEPTTALRPRPTRPTPRRTPPAETTRQPEEDEPTSTTGRLLRMKKRWKKDSEGDD